jgi:hypothetical protein
MEIKRLFTPARKITPNLSKLHLILLEKLPKEDSIVYTNSNKGLDIVAVELKRYIEWGL